MSSRREGKQPISDQDVDDSGPRHPRSRKVLASARRADASVVDASPVVESPITESQINTSPPIFHPLLYRAQESFRDEGSGSAIDEESFREEEEDSEEGEGEGVCMVRKGRGGRFVSSRKSSLGAKRKKGRDQESWLVTECMPGGPEDDACIPSFAGHVACDLWQGLDRGTLMCCTRHAACASLRTWHRSFMDGVEDNDGVILPRTTDDLRVDQIVSESELGDLSSLMYRHIDFPLLLAFVERWQPDTNTFHLPFGEMTIMLHDVAQILGLSIDGKVVAGYSATNNDLGDVAELLGLPKETLTNNQLYKNGGIQSEAVFDLCWRADGRDPTTRARAYMFLTLGSTLFVDKSGSRVRPSLIRELYGQVHEYAWGAATLAYLYHELGLASRKKCKKLAGCLTLLQAWIYEYFPAFRPHRGENPLRDDEPRCRKWIVRQESKSHDRLVMFRRRLDRMTSDEVMWLPYGAREVELHPRTLFTGCIAYHDYVEPYIPYRCVHQLGYVQNVPPRIPRPLRVCRAADPNKYMLKFAAGSAEEQWDGFPYMNALNHTLLQFCSYNGIIHRDYLPWFMKHSHPYVVNDRDYVPPAGPDVTLLEHWLARLFDKSDILFDPVLEALPSPEFNRARLKLLELRDEMEHVETVAGRRRQGPPVRPPPGWQD